MQAKIEELKKARELRNKGFSVRSIASQLGVARSSVSVWVRDVVLSEEQKDCLFDRWKKGLLRGNLLVGGLNRAKYLQLREGYQKEGRKLAKQKDPDFFAGCMLYWAEGTKSRTIAQITNSDVNMLKYFVSFLKKFFKTQDEDISVTCHYYCSNGLTPNEVEDHWLSKLSLPKICFKKTTVNRMVRTSNKERQERTKYGVVKISVFDVRVVQIIYGAIQEIAGFTNEEWAKK